MSEKYVLITPAKNEEANIENLVNTIASQTIKPFKWLIVSNGSMDRTEEFVKHYATKHSFIELLIFNEFKQRDFAVKVHAINNAYQTIKGLSFQYVGTLDADIILEPSYYENILGKFKQDHNLGIAGGMVYEKQNGKYANRFGSTEIYVPGAIQLFRKECFDQIGGYQPMKYGGEDMVADEMARMYGWTVKSFAEYHALHNRRTGANDLSVLHTKYRCGISDYFMAYHPLYELFKFFRRIAEKPYFMGSVARVIGYFSVFVRREKLILSSEIVDHIRKEQLNRIKACFRI